MLPDKYGETVVRNIYFDTPDYRLIRRSIEKPEYKEKLRLRSYKKADADSIVFAELKKKYKGVVYKRRLPLGEKEAVEWLCGRKQLSDSCQISREIDYFLKYYNGLRPSAFLSYERQAFYSKTDQNLRITFDRNILCRTEDISLEAEVWGTPLLDDNSFLMEIKCVGGIPLWLASFLSREKIYKTSFSKYGTAYQKFIYKKGK